MFDSAPETNQHRLQLLDWCLTFVLGVLDRARVHDLSKLEPPEKECFDTWVPHLQRVTFGSEEYKRALSHMGEGLAHHYQRNRHHPEHFPEGIEGMNLLDLVEMVADWIASAEAKGSTVNLEILDARFDLGPQLRAIIANTIRDQGSWTNTRY